MMNKPLAVFLGVFLSVVAVVGTVKAVTLQFTPEEFKEFGVSLPPGFNQSATTSNDEERFGFTSPSVIRVNELITQTTSTIFQNTVIGTSTDYAVSSTRNTRLFVDLGRAGLSGIILRRVDTGTSDFLRGERVDGTSVFLLDTAGNLSTSGTSSFATSTFSGNILPASNNTYDIGAYGSAWRDVYASGVIRALGLQTTGQPIYVTDPDSQTLVASIVSQISTSTLATTDQLLGNYTEATFTGPISSGLPVMRAGRYQFIYNGVMSGTGAVNIGGISSAARFNSSSISQSSSATGMSNVVEINASSTIGTITALSNSIDPFTSSAAGSFVNTSTSNLSFINIDQNMTFRRAYGVRGEIRGSVGQIFRGIGVYGFADSASASSSFSGYFRGSPVWIDADDNADDSNHGASNTPGSLFVGNVAEFNDGVFVDGRLSASSTLLVTGSATTTHIYPWTNNTYDLGAYGNAWRTLYASTSVLVGSTVEITATNVSSSNRLLIGSTGAGNDIIFSAGAGVRSDSPLKASSTLLVTGVGTFYGNIVLGDAAADTITLNGQMASTILPNVNDTLDIGGYGGAWNDFYGSGTIRFGEPTIGNLLPNYNNISDLGAFGQAMRSLYVSTSVRVGAGVASTTIGANGNITMTGSITPSTNNSSDLGASGLAWNELFVSGTSFLGTVSSSQITPWANATFDLGAFGRAWDEIIASGSFAVGSQSNELDYAPGSGRLTLTAAGVSSPGVFPGSNNALDLGSIVNGGQAWRNMAVSSTAFFGPVSSTLITPWSNNIADLGASGNAWNELFVSGTAYLGSVSSTQITPWASNTYDFGSFGAAWRDLYVSGAIRLGSGLIGSSTLGANGNLFLSGGIVVGGRIEPSANNTIDIGGFSEAFNDIVASGTAFLDTVSSSQITPWANNLNDLGSFGRAWRTLYASTSLIIGGRNATTTLDLQSNPSAPTTGKGTCIPLTDTDGTQRFISVIAGTLTVSTANCQ